MKYRSRLVGIAFLKTLVLISSLFVDSSAQHAAPEQAAVSPKLTAEQWQADVRFLGEELPKQHRNAFHRLKREDFEAAVRKLHDAAPTMSEDEIIVGLMKVVAMIKDGHTNAIPFAFFRRGVYPFKLYL